MTYPKGSPERPLSQDELTRKFARLTADVVTPQRRDEVAERVHRLEEVPDIGELARLLAREA